MSCKVNEVEGARVEQWTRHILSLQPFFFYSKGIDVGENKIGSKSLAPFGAKSAPRQKILESEFFDKIPAELSKIRIH